PRARALPSTASRRPDTTTERHAARACRSNLGEPSENSSSGESIPSPPVSLTYVAFRTTETQFGSTPTVKLRPLAVAVKSFCAQSLHKYCSSGPPIAFAEQNRDR